MQQLPNILQEITQQNNVEQLRQTDYFETLVAAVQMLMNTQPNYLLQLMYNLDVQEQKIAHALKTQQHQQARALAQLIVERQLQKIISRQTYQQPHIPIPDVDAW